MKALIEFWQYSIETVCRNKQENLWQIAFRGVNDQPFGPPSLMRRKMIRNVQILLTV